MFPLELFFKKLYNYFHTQVCENLDITTAIRLKSWAAYKMYVLQDEYRFNRAIQSLSFEVLRCKTNCFTVRDDDTDVVSFEVETPDEEEVWQSYDYFDYEAICLSVKNIYLIGLPGIVNEFPHFITESC